jgi:hypothetical protein
MDQSGAVIANATVAITEKATGTPRTLTTNNAGLYSAPALLAASMKCAAKPRGSGLSRVRRL